jgi:hypothetical protein
MLSGIIAHENSVDPLQFYQRFVSTLAKRFKESARETRATLTELVGGGVRLMATKDRQELTVYCGLGSTTLPVLRN